MKAHFVLHETLHAGCLSKWAQSGHRDQTKVYENEAHQRQWMRSDLIVMEYPQSPDEDREVFPYYDFSRSS